MIPLGLFGTNRAEIARSLILDQLKRLAAEGIVKMRQTQDSNEVAFLPKL